MQSCFQWKDDTVSRPMAKSWKGQKRNENEFYQIQQYCEGNLNHNFRCHCTNHSGQATKSRRWTEQIYDGETEAVDHREKSQISVQRIVRLEGHAWIIDGINSEKTVISRFFRNCCKHGTKWFWKCTKFYE